MADEQTKIINEMIRDIAKIGYNSQFEDGWDNLPNNSMERIIWQRTAREIIDYLMKFGECLGHEVDKQGDSKIILTKEAR
ncbi:MAG: hypothetical protein AMQ22_00670 [Candidatus Methanofastidiosum methylothiophilum]|uniref:Uncharacterized protein n=1 Tax=Candidatus Methanofastidiosum methylothiophilum TaxID=1705564 RepID=A0A150J5X8_9EURY|nr:MAG: hypothetical protein AMQ22_00670 [Candidatus Methanofastidiosum methylthiophilus]